MAILDEPLLRVTIRFGIDELFAGAAHDAAAVDSHRMDDLAVHDDVEFVVRLIDLAEIREIDVRGKIHIGVRHDDLLVFCR